MLLKTSALDILTLTGRWMESKDARSMQVSRKYGGEPQHYHLFNVAYLAEEVLNRVSRIQSYSHLVFLSVKLVLIASVIQIAATIL